MPSTKCCAGRIAGAALDCFVGEPLKEPHRFGQFDNVLLAPHSIAWTDEMFRDMGNTICRAMVELAHGRRPRGVINAEVLEPPRLPAEMGPTANCLTPASPPTAR